MKREEIQKEVDRLNRKFHKRLTVERYLKLKEEVRRSNMEWYYDPPQTVEEYLEERKGYFHYETEDDFSDWRKM